MIWTWIGLAVAIYGLRGAMLGFVRASTNFLSLVGAYFLGLSYRVDGATVLAPYFPQSFPFALLQALAGLTIFVCTAFLISRGVVGVFEFLKKRNQRLATQINDNKNQGRFWGAMVNACVAFFVCLLLVSGLMFAQRVAGIAKQVEVPENLAALASVVGEGVLLSYFEISGGSIATIETNVGQEQLLTGILQQLMQSNSGASTDSRQVINNAEYQQILEQYQGINSELLESQLLDQNAFEKQFIKNKELQGLVKGLDLQEALENQEVNKILQDPQIQEMLEDPALQEQILLQFQDIMDN